jgi:hypothetical protein
MAKIRDRREFLKSVSYGTLLATMGPAFLSDFGIASRAFAEEATDPPRLNFGELEPLVCLMQETPIEQMQAVAIAKIQQGVSLKSLTAAAALANARTFGGEDYIGFHTFMAFSPALRMASMMPEGEAALPVLKVLFRNNHRIHEFGGRGSEVLRDTTPQTASPQTPDNLQSAIRSQNTHQAEVALASLGAANRLDAFEALLPCVQDNPEVHRTVLPFRAWEMQQVVGTEHAMTLLRQSIHYCIRVEPYRTSSWKEHGELLVQLLDEYRLLSNPLGSKPLEDSAFQKLAETFATASPPDAARAAAQCLAEGFTPDTVGEALSLAASRLVLSDRGRPPQWEDRLKPAGSVHGDSVGVHASDSANAWRNMSKVCRTQGKIACLLIGVWQIARDRVSSDNFLKEELPSNNQLNQLTHSTPQELLVQLDRAIRDNLQGKATAIAHRFGQLSGEPGEIFSILLRYAVSEDGALHAEKYFHTVWDDFYATRASARWQHVAALARVTASEYGKPAAGQAEARKLLNIKDPT